MALIKCPECGKEISDKAIACPNCGCPMESKVTDKTQLNEPTTPPKNVSSMYKKEHTPINSTTKLIIGIISGIIIIGAIAIYLLTSNLRTYQKAEKLLNNKDYVSASTIYKNLGDYKDSEKKYSECLYMKANQLYTENNFAEAEELYHQIENYKDAQEKISDCQYQQTVDAQFLRTLVNTLQERWSITNSGNEKEYLQSCVDLELKNLQKFNNAEFNDSKLGKYASKHIKYLEEAKNTLAFYSIDYNKYYSQWYEIYGKRCILLQKLIDKYDLKFEEKYNATLKELSSSASAAQEKRDFENDITKMVKTFTAEAITGEYNQKMIKVTLKNTTNYTFDYFYTNINLIDENGTIIEVAYMDQINNFTPNQEAVLDVYRSKDFVSVSFEPHYQCGNYYK